ncbi:MAG: hypothetical protein RIQ68_554 [Pseudomonadota bacterium]
MISGGAEKFCFGPTEIDVMRRAMQIAEQALRRSDGTNVHDALRPIAHSILRMTAAGQSDPLVMSAVALREHQSSVAQIFHPYERRLPTRRAHMRCRGVAMNACKIA